jgi:predicted Zn finger-like uncharacterized protein
MILTCPACATRYQADAAKFASPGRKVRCAKCGHIWHQEAPPPEPEPGLETVTEVPEPEPAPRMPEPIPPRRTAYVPPEPEPEAEAEQAPPAPSRWGRMAALTLGWLGLIAAVLIVAWSALTYRQQIATLWPQSASLYARLGLTVNARGIGIADINYRNEMEDGQVVLMVTGNLVNITARELPVPPIRVTLSGEDNRELYHWNFSAPVATLKPGQSAAFQTRLSSPPPGARHLEVRFAEDNG